MHPDLVDLFNQLGYAKTPGLCHGLAIRWIEACLLNEEHLFLARLEAILARGVAIKKDFARVKAKKGKNLTEEDLTCFEVMGFFDSLAFFQTPARYAKFSGKSVAQGNVDLFSSLASSRKIHERGGLSTVYSTSNLYYREEIKSYFDDLTNLIDVLDIPADETIGFLLSSLTHSIALTYSKNRGWSFMDSNQYPPKLVRTDELPQLLAQAFFLPIEENQLAFTTRVITTRNNPKLATLTDTFNQLEQRYLLTEEKVVGKSCSSILAQLLVLDNESQKFGQLMRFYFDLSELTDDSAALVYIAAECGNVDVLVELAKHGVDLNQPAFGGETPLYVAAFYGHAAIVAQLAQYGVDLNQLLLGGTPLYIAATLGHEEVVAELIRHNVDIDRPSTEGTTPLFIAAQEGHRSIVELLLKQKANLNLYLTKSADELSYFSSWKKDDRVISRMNDFVMQKVLNETPENKDVKLYKLFRWLISSFSEMPEGGSTWFYNLFKSITSFLFYCFYGDTPIQVSPYDIALIMGHHDIAELLDPRQPQIRLSLNSELFFPAHQNASEHIPVNEQTKFIDGVFL